jgi:TRAP-type C4-dicarboxylate transport system substrate-binding protein
MTTPDVLVVSKRWFDSLPAEDQIMIRKALRFAVVRQRTLWLSWIEQMMSQVQEARIQIQTVERTPFEHAVQPVYGTLSEQNEALAEAIQAIDQVK